jgi:hypothetical protein
MSRVSGSDLHGKSWKQICETTTTTQTPMRVDRPSTVQFSGYKHLESCNTGKSGVANRAFELFWPLRLEAQDNALSRRKQGFEFPRGCQNTVYNIWLLFSVMMAEESHPFPFRTRKLRPPAPMVLPRMRWESRSLPGANLQACLRCRSQACFFM